MNKDNQPKVFVVVLNYNGLKFIKKCLTSLFNVTYQNLSVVVVDNGSKDGSLEVARTNFSKAYFIKNEKNLGFAAGVNVGIRFSLERMADYVIVLNQDTEVEDNFISELVSVGEEKKEIGILSPVIFKSGGGEVWFAGGKIDWAKMRIEHFQKSFPERYVESSFISGCSMMIKKEVFRKVGLFDEDLFLYYEDADMSVRSLQEGFKNVVVSGSWIYHAEDSNKKSFEKNKLYWLVLSGLIFFHKNASFIQKIWLKIYTLLRRIKNWRDLIFKKDLEKAKIIKRAFSDYRLISSEKNTFHNNS